MAAVGNKMFEVVVFEKVGEQTVEAGSRGEAITRVVCGFKHMHPDSEFVGEIKAEYGREL